MGVGETCFSQKQTLVLCVFVDVCLHLEKKEGGVYYLVHIGWLACQSVGRSVDQILF